MRRNLAAIAAVLAAGVLAAVVLVQFAPSAGASVTARDTSRTVVGAWYVDTIGAPFLPHAMAFTGEGLVLITNPDAAEAGNSSSAGMGAWGKGRRDTVVGQFLEVNANKTGPQANKFWSNLIVTFTVTVRGDRFEGPASATYYDGAGRPIAGLADQGATLKGQRITVDSKAPVIVVP